MHTEHGGEACLEGTVVCHVRGKNSKHCIGIFVQGLVNSVKRLLFLVAWSYLATNVCCVYVQPLTRVMCRVRASCRVVVPE